MPAFVSFIANGLVLIYRSKAYKKISLGNIIIMNLALADILMSFYLTGIGIADHWFSGRYALEMETWKNSILCKLTGVVAVIATEMSLFFLVLISVFYLFVIGYNKARYAINKLRLAIFCKACWIVLTPVCFLPLSGLANIQSGSCLFFRFMSQDQSELSWYYNILFYVVFNVLLLLVSITCTIMFVLKVHASAQNVRKTGSISKGRNKKGLYIWMMVLVLSNLMCWLPFEVLMIMSLSGYRFNMEVVQWFSILVLPLNSVSNPFLYTVRMLMKK